MDGDLSDPVWRDRPVLSGLRNFLGPLQGDLATQASEFAIVTDGPRLYIGVTFHDDNMAAVLFDPSRDAFWNDCTELYFDPRHDGRRSIQLVVDCGGQRFWEKQMDEGWGWFADRGWSILADWQAAVARGKDAWTLELSIGAGSFGIDTQPGSICGFNACRFRLGAEKQEFSAWGFEGSQRQKNMDAWGHLLFAAEGVRAAGVPLLAEEIRAISPDPKRRLEIPAEGGLALIEGGQARQASFTELIGPHVEALRSALQAARESVDALGDDPRARPVRDRFPALEADALAAIKQAEAGNLSMGAYDRLRDASGRLEERLGELAWQANLVRLVTEVGKGGGAP